MTARPKCCPLCRQVTTQLELLVGVEFVKRHNKSAAIEKLVREVGAAGLTHEEISKVMKLSHATVSARLHDLQRRGVLKVSGKRATLSGRLASVFVAHDVVTNAAPVVGVLET